jgi:hypothetical protein
MCKETNDSDGTTCSLYLLGTGTAPSHAIQIQVFEAMQLRHLTKAEIDRMLHVQP